MKKKKRIISLILVALMLITMLLTGCSTEPAASGSENPGDPNVNPVRQGKNIDQDPLKIAFIPLSTSGVSCALTIKGIEDVLSSYPNIKLSVFDPQFDVSKEVTIFNECITQGFDGIIFENMDPETLNNVVVEAEKAGIPVVNYGLQVTAPHTFGIKGSDYPAGWIAAEYLCKALNDKGNVAILDAPAAQSASCIIYPGFKDYLEKNNKTNMKIVDYQNVEAWSMDNANQITRDLLTKHSGNIDAIFAVSDDLALGAVQAAIAADKPEILIWGVGGFPNALKAIEDGTLYGTSFWDSYNQSTAATMMLLSAISSGITGANAGYTHTPVVQIPSIPCTKENIQEIMSSTHQSFK